MLNRQTRSRMRGAYRATIVAGEEVLAAEQALEEARRRLLQARRAWIDAHNELDTLQRVLVPPREWVALGGTAEVNARNLSWLRKYLRALGKR